MIHVATDLRLDDVHARANAAAHRVALVRSRPASTTPPDSINVRDRRLDASLNDPTTPADPFAPSHRPVPAPATPLPHPVLSP
jgi:hypothetical protein